MPEIGELDITTDPASGGGTVVAVSGEVDLVTAPALSEALESAIAQGGPVVVVDLEQVGFLDSTGIAAIARATRSAEQHGVALRLCSVQPHVARVLDVAGLGAHWDLFPDRAAALAG